MVWAKQWSMSGSDPQTIEINRVFYTFLQIPSALKNDTWSLDQMSKCNKLRARMCWPNTNNIYMIFLNLLGYIFSSCGRLAATTHCKYHKFKILFLLFAWHWNYIGIIQLNHSLKSNMKLCHCWLLLFHMEIPQELCIYDAFF